MPRPVVDFLVIAPANAPFGDGKFVFYPEAVRFTKYLRNRAMTSHLALFDVKETRVRRRSDILAGSKDSIYRHAAVFCHGWESGLQCGLAKADWGAVLIAGPALTHVTLYACSAGEGPGVGGEGGYADGVRESLAGLGFNATVLAHRSKGHATTNPTWALFTTETLDDGGSLLASPANQEWRKWLKVGENRFALAVDPMAWARRVK